eukprot:TRINITY_DN1366_c0_g1_i6.p1 TRINITY_DN1366_c0_g1~~TRINITY_DN1366_c0_g1_i6.p1  ORF type:complete len:464 (-),score=133.53 TRINITY_DN1366_c0_g1_i6:425-1816(-)
MAPAAKRATKQTRGVAVSKTKGSQSKTAKKGRTTKITVKLHLPRKQPNKKGGKKAATTPAAAKKKSTEKQWPEAKATHKCDLKGTEKVQAEAFMQTAAASALAGVRICHGGPFGASIVRDGVVISCAHNMVLHCGDPTKHAEMNAIHMACKALGTHDLSDCDLYTTCEPCPMCWGAVQWSGLRKAYIGVDRHTAAKYGFDDKVFYDEVDAKAGHYGLKRYGYITDTSVKGKKNQQRVHKNMVEIFDGVCHVEVAKRFADPEHNRSLGDKGASSTVCHEKLANSCKPVRHVSECDSSKKPLGMEVHEHYMKEAIKAAEIGVRDRKNKEREPFGCVVVKEGQIVAEAHNMVLESRDATATAEVTAIRAASARLRTHNLDGCYLYSTAHPDLMSLGAILWARISRVYCGVTQQLAAQCGHDAGMNHFKDLLEVQNGQQATKVFRNIAVKDCEAVFKEWSDRNGVIY